MATLTGNTIKDTYQSLLKVNDNGELAATLQEITDGVGTGSGVSLNTTGDLKAEGTIEFGSLKDTGEAITITKFVDEADGIANNDNDTSIPTSAAIIDYVAAKITEEDLDFAGDSGTGSVDLDSQIFTIGGTANQIETTATGQSLTIAFPSAGVVLPDGSTATTQAVSDDSTKVATTAYVKSVLTQEDLDFQGDTGTGSVDLDSEVLDIAGGTGIDTVASGQTLTVNIDSTVATLTGTQTLTNKTINADNNTISNLEVDNLKAGVLDTDLTTVSASDDTLASAKAIKTYVDSQVTAQDLDITDGTTTSSVDLDSETMTIQGTANEVEVSLTDQTFTVGLPDTINVNVSGNITGDITGNADTATALETARDIALSGDVVGSASFDGTANITIAATIQADSVALGTDTTGDYVANLGTGTGVTIGSNTGEGSQPTISVDYGSTANTAVQGNTEITINGTTNQIEITGTANQALGGAPSYTVGLPNDVTIAGSLIVSNDLTVNGTTTTVNTQTLSVEDPLIALAIANDANSVDTGFYAKYSLDSGLTTKFAGLFKDASDTDTFKLFKGLEVEPTTTVDTAGTGYALADIQVAGLEATTIVKTGGSSTEFLKADGSIDSNTYLTAESDTLNSVTGRGNTTSNSIQVGAATITGSLTVDTTTLYVDSANNRVAVGTTNAQQKLHVQDAGAVSIRLNDSTTNYWDLTNDSNLIFSRGGTERVRIHSGGDISFRDTSNNEAFYWDASASGLGINVNDPDAQLEIVNSSGGSYRLGYAGGTDSYFDSENFYIRSGNGGSNKFIVNASGNIGIGTANPSGKLTVDGASTPSSTPSGTFQITNLGGGTPTQINMGVLDASPFYGWIQAQHQTLSGFYYNLLLQPQGGNVGIGTTNPSAKLSINKNEGSSATTTFTTSNSYLQLGTTDYNTSGAVYAIGLGYSSGATNSPAYIGLKQTATGSYTKGDLLFLTRDSTDDIAPTERMRVLSSGGLTFNGDTAAANALDDYEEGTFTPELADAAAGGNTASPSDANGSYVKVGSMVTISIQLQNTDLTGMTGTNTAYIRNLPFSAKNLTGAIKFNATPRLNLFSANANNMHTTVELGDNTNYIYFEESLTNSANAVISTVNQFANGSDIFFTMTYFAD